MLPPFCCSQACRDSYLLLRLSTMGRNFVSFSGNISWKRLLISDSPCVHAERKARSETNAVKQAYKGLESRKASVLLLAAQMRRKAADGYSSVGTLQSLLC